MNKINANKKMNFKQSAAKLGSKANPYAGKELAEKIKEVKKQGRDFHGGQTAVNFKIEFGKHLKDPKKWGALSAQSEKQVA